ncbi:UNVERIFIED_CONTAM: hypothetical protein PYX00_000840 [Menopon gallinae]|uniref:CCHC-type domain-containing protein n=1 Tax=Menopon gallinae TaxID=328185 RepID=A0AAW2IBV9_9NEOP
MQLHDMLRERKKRANESALEYFLEMKKIARQGSIDDFDLMQYVIEGIPDDPHRLILHGTKKLSTFRERLKEYDLIKSRRAKTEKPTPIVSKFGVKEKEERMNSIRCFNCGRSGHKSVECKEKSLGPKCFKCNLHGHLSSNCTTTKIDVNIVTVENFRKLPEKEVKIKGMNFMALIDTGSQLNLINSRTHRAMGGPELKESTIILSGFGKVKAKPYGYFEEKLKIDNDEFYTKFYVIKDDLLEPDVILGQSLLDETEFLIRKNEVTIRRINDVKPIVEKDEVKEEEEEDDEETNEEEEVIRDSEDAVAKLKEELAEKEKVLAREQETSQNLRDKLEKLKMEYDTERYRLTRTCLRYEETIQAKQDEILNLRAKCKSSEENHISDKQALNQKLQQLQDQINDDKTTIREFREENNQTHDEVQKDPVSRRQEMKTRMTGIKERHQEKENDNDNDFKARNKKPGFLGFYKISRYKEADVNDVERSYERGTSEDEDQEVRNRDEKRDVDSGFGDRSCSGRPNVGTAR